MVLDGLHSFSLTLGVNDQKNAKLSFILSLLPLQVSDAGVDTLIPLSLQGKDNPILQQLLPTLLNPAVLGELEPSVCHCHDCYQS